MGDQEPWYTNKDLFEKLQKLSEELNETRTVVKKYNNLVEKLYRNEKRTDELCDDVRCVSDKVAEIIHQSKGRSTAFELVRTWTPWIITTLTILTYYSSK